MDHIEFQLAHRHLIAILEPTIRLESMRFHVPARTVVIKLRDPEPVLLVRAFNRHAHFLGKHTRHAAVVEMAMGDENLLQRHPGLFQRLTQLGQVPPGIDKGTAHRPGAPQERAILLERRDRNDPHPHRTFVGSFGHAAGDGRKPP